MDIHLDILDEKRRNLLPTFASFKDDGFYLAGGTALALQIGHRDSVDFDFFKQASFDTQSLFERIRSHLQENTLLKTQESKDTLYVVINDEVRLSFMSFPYPLMMPLVETPSLSLAAIEDIGCMKLSAITGRSSLKDYVDLYFILGRVPLTKLLELLKKKMPSLDTLLVIKSLVYFEDIVEEPILYKIEPIPLSLIKESLTAQAHSYKL